MADQCRFLPRRIDARYVGMSKCFTIVAFDMRRVEAKAELAAVSQPVLKLAPTRVSKWDFQGRELSIMLEMYLARVLH
jgi:hypothetical protein